MTDKRSFTLIELIITIVLLGIIMIPLGVMSMELVRGAARTDQSSMAANLARMEMAEANNIPYDTLAGKSKAAHPSYPSYDVERIVDPNNVPPGTKKITVRVYPAGQTTQLIELNTLRYVTAVTGKGSGGNAPKVIDPTSYSITVIPTSTIMYKGKSAAIQVLSNAPLVYIKDQGTANFYPISDGYFKYRTTVYSWPGDYQIYFYPSSSDYQLTGKYAKVAVTVLG